jgi:hypothetical protein
MQWVVGVAQSLRISRQLAGLMGDLSAPHAKYIAIRGSNNHAIPLSAKNVRSHTPKRAGQSPCVPWCASLGLVAGGLTGQYCCWRHAVFLWSSETPGAGSTRARISSQAAFTLLISMPRPLVRGVERNPEHAARMHGECEKHAPAGSTSTWPGTSRCQVKANQHQTLKADPPESRQVKAIQVHQLVPGCHKVMDKLLLRVRGGIDLGQGTQLGV